MEDMCLAEKYLNPPGDVIFFVCRKSRNTVRVPSIEMAMDDSTAKSISTVPNLVVISSPFQQTPLMRLSKSIPMPTKTVSELQHSADRFLCFIRSQTSLFKKLLSSSSSSFQTFCNQVASPLIFRLFSFCSRLLVV